MLFRVHERGQGFFEYALIILLVALIVIAVVVLLGPFIGNMFTKVNSGFPSS